MPSLDRTAHQKLVETDMSFASWIYSSFKNLLGEFASLRCALKRIGDDVLDMFFAEIVEPEAESKLTTSDLRTKLRVFII